MKALHVRVQRFDPKTDKEPRVELYTVSVNDGARYSMSCTRSTIRLIPRSRTGTVASGQCGSAQSG